MGKYIVDFVHTAQPLPQRQQNPLSCAGEVCRKFSTEETLQRLREVTRDTITPSWLGSVPSNFSNVATGTIKADEWQSLITVYLPIALISLWEMGTGNSNFKLILDHTMDLVSAVYIACARTMSSERAKEYRLSIASYVDNLKRIYLMFDPRPNHHALFHIYDYLVLFGPVHSWWSFPFEHLIRILQCLPNNHKSGQYSILHHSLR
jgi:hypothetical protein